jgi:hypothetical protein
MNKRNIIAAIFTVMILSGIVLFIPAALNAQDTLSKEKIGISIWLLFTCGP